VIGKGVLFLKGFYLITLRASRDWRKPIVGCTLWDDTHAVAVVVVVVVLILPLSSCTWYSVLVVLTNDGGVLETVAHPGTSLWILTT
jgi:hypothetical protein